MNTENTPPQSYAYYLYRRNSIDDIDSLREKVNEIVSKSDDTKDIVIDFGDSKAIASVEIGLLVKVINKIRAKSNRLNIIAGAGIRDVLRESGLETLDCVAIFNDKESFFASLNNCEADC